MNAELLPLPNMNSKILRANILTVPKNISLPFYKGGKSVVEYFEDKIKDFDPDCEELDILLIIFHLYLTNKSLDGLLYFNTDDILILRGVKKNKALKNGSTGYKREVRERIRSKIFKLYSYKIFAMVDYKDFNFVLDFSEEFTKDIESTMEIDRKLLALNPYTKSWHKSIGLFLSFRAHKLKIASKRKGFEGKKTRCFEIQVRKILSKVKPLSVPCKTRERFENALDELNACGVFKGWQYKNIDENELSSKNWLFFWHLLSVKILF